jgi:hypothetical protein
VPTTQPPSTRCLLAATAVGHGDPLCYT